MKTRAHTGKMFGNEEDSKKLQKDAKKVLTEARNSGIINKLR